ncbi:MAG: primosomal protein N' [Clostridia bacterium]
MENKIVAAVILDNTTRSYDKVYNYLVPESMACYLETGMRVMVPFGSGDTAKVAYFLDFIAYDKKFDKIKMKYISELLDDEALVSKSMFRLARDIRDEYFCTYGQALNAMVPLGLRISVEKLVLLEDGKLIPFQAYLQSAPGGIKQINEEIKENRIKIVEQGIRNMKNKFEKAVRLLILPSEINELIFKDRIKNEKHIRVLELLAEYEDITINDFASYENISRNVLSTLEKKGYIESFLKPRKQDEQNVPDIAPTSTEKHFTDDQKYVIDRISMPIQEGKYDKFLIHGITGSGKTEVYMKLVSEVLAKGKSSIVLVPEIGLTPLMVNRFTQRFGNNLVVMHSRLSMKERYSAWMRIKRGEVAIALGTRSCIFAPFSNLGLIVIDEEHDGSYISECTPKYHTNFVADRRAKEDGAILVLGSATPKVTTYDAMDKQGRVLTMSNRALGKLPDVSLVDMRDDTINGHMSVFSNTLIKEIEKNIANGEQTVLFLNRRGYSSMQLCTKCRTVVKCEHCDVPMTYHKGKDFLVCHYCGHIQRKSGICPVCKEETMMECGAGTEKVEAELHELFPEASVLRMDLDTTGMKNSHRDLLEKFENEKVDILIGTQMIAKGHDYPLVTLVGILNADALGSGLFYESSENAYQLITQASGRAGRSDLKGRAIIQAYNVDSPLIENAIKQDYQSFYSTEMRIRKILDFPPYTSMAIIMFTSMQQHLADENAAVCYNILHNTGMTVFAPSRPQISKLNDKFRTRIIVKCKDPKEMKDDLTKAYLYMAKKLPKTVTMGIDVYCNEF